MNHVVQVELIDLAGLEFGEAGTHALKQYSQLILVVRGDQLSRGAAIGLLRRTMLRVASAGHKAKLQRAGFALTAGRRPYPAASRIRR